MDINQLKDIISENKKCDKCEADNKSGNWLVSFAADKAIFECKKCGFIKRLKV